VVARAGLHARASRLAAADERADGPFVRLRWLFRPAFADEPCRLPAHDVLPTRRFPVASSSTAPSAAAGNWRRGPARAVATIARARFNAVHTTLACDELSRSRRRSGNVARLAELRSRMRIAITDAAVGKRLRSTRSWARQDRPRLHCVTAKNATTTSASTRHDQWAFGARSISTASRSRRQLANRRRTDRRHLSLRNHNLRYFIRAVRIR